MFSELASVSAIDGRGGLGDRGFFTLTQKLDLDFSYILELLSICVYL
jgi:hypothetical protein